MEAGTSPHKWKRTTGHSHQIGHHRVLLDFAEDPRGRVRPICRGEAEENFGAGCGDPIPAAFGPVAMSLTPVDASSNRGNTKHSPVQQVMYRLQMSKQAMPLVQLTPSGTPNTRAGGVCSSQLTIMGSKNLNKRNPWEKGWDRGSVESLMTSVEYLAKKVLLFPHHTQAQEM